MGWKMKLIDNWKQAWKLKSVQVGAISTFFYLLILFSEQFLGLWSIIPQDLKNLIPEKLTLWVSHGILSAKGGINAAK